MPPSLNEGGTDFITQITYQCQPWLCGEIARHGLPSKTKTPNGRIPNGGIMYLAGIA
jgi:hypothetical protein